MNMKQQRWLSLSALAFCVAQSMSIANAEPLTVESEVKGDPIYLSPRSESEVLPQMRAHQCRPFIHLYYGNRAPKKQFMQDVSEVTPDLDLILWKDSKREMYRLIGDTDQPYVDAKRLRSNGVVPDAFLWTWNPESGADSKPCSEEPQPVVKETVAKEPVVEPVKEPVAEPVAEKTEPKSDHGLDFVFGVQGGYQMMKGDNDSGLHGPLWGVFGGVKLTDNLRWELGYQDHKRVQNSSTKLKTEFFDTALRYEMPIKEALGLYGKLGVAYWEFDNISASASDNGYSGLGEVGVQYHLSNELSVGLGYQYVHDIGSSSTGKYDSHGALLNLTYDLP